MSAAEKATIIAKVASSPLPKRKVLSELGIPKSTYIGGSDERTSNDLRTVQEAVSPHGTVLPSKKFNTSCRLPGNCQS